jgi:hypothetical protein
MRCGAGLWVLLPALALEIHGQDGSTGGSASIRKDALTSWAMAASLPNTGRQGQDLIDRRPRRVEPDQKPGRRSLRALRVLQENGIDYNRAYIPDDFPDTSTQAFDPIWMGKLYDLGFRMAEAGSPWKKVPPRMAGH